MTQIYKPTQKAIFTLFLFLSAIGLNAQVSTYSFSQSLSTYTPLSGGTVIGAPSNDDQRFVNPSVPAGGTTTTGVGFPIGFNFTYNGIAFDRFAVDYNGWISLGQSTLTPSVDLSTYSQYGCLSSTTVTTPPLLRNRIAGIARDLEGQSGSTITVQTLGTTPNQVCVIEWAGVRRYGDSDTLNFQIRLYETTNVVEVQYGNIVFDGSDNSTGTSAPEIGLGGTVATDYNNRVTTTNWNNTTTGASNVLGCEVNTGVIYPVSGTTFDWTPPVLCSGAPTAGTVVAPNSVCSGTSFAVSLNGNTTGGGLSYQWISSADDITYANIDGDSSVTVDLSQTADIYYKCIITCNASGLSDTTASVLVTLNPANQCYCASTYTYGCSGFGDDITNVTLGALNNSSACSPSYYTFYDTVPVPVLLQTVSYNISISFGSDGNQYSGVWIDYNQNGDFSDPGEFVAYSTVNPGSNGTSTLNFVVPSNAMLGQTRMRVRGGNDYQLTNTPCGISSADFGETEDYLVEIQAAPTCTNPPTAGSINGASGVCSGNSTTLSLTGYTLGTSLQWEESTDSITWSELTGETNTTYTTPALTDSMFYRVAVRCADTAYTNAFEVSINPFYACYCVSGIGGFCDIGEADISNVNIPTTTLNNSSTCNMVGADDYSIFPASGSSTATLYAGVSYTLNVNCTDPAIISVWIDYNHDGNFDASEWTQVTTNAQNGTATITIPLSATLGQTGMRIRSRYSGNTNGAGDACSNFGSGECEDYTIDIENAPPCTTPPVGGIIIGPSSGVAFSTYTYYSTGSTGTIEWEYSGVSALGPYTPVPGAANDDSLQIAFTAGGSYWIRAYLTTPGCDPDSSNVVQTDIIFTGDDVCDAIAINFGTNGPYNTTAATVQPGEPSPPGGGCSDPLNWCSDNTITNTMWFTFVAPASGRVSVQSPDFDTQLALWDADSCGAILNGGATLLAANDDDPNAAADGGVDYSSFLDTVPCLTPGRTYYIQLDPYSSPGASTRIILTDLGGVSAPLAVSLVSSTDVTCYGAGDGSIDMDVTGGSGNYSYMWNSGETSQDLSGINGGTYNLSVSDLNCNSSVTSDSVVINEPTQIVGTLDSLVPVRCFGESTGGIYVTVTGGVPPYTYAWSNGSTDPNLTGVPEGSYSGTVIDNTGCILTSPPVPVTEPSAPLSLILDSVFDNLCGGGMTGGVYITVDGGTPAYTYAWSDGASVEDNTGIAAGSYEVSVTDANGCTVPPVSATVGDGAFITINVDSVVGNTCAGLTDGGVYISVNGGVPNYTYSWSDGTTNEDDAGVAAGTYTVSVSDANGCSSTASETVADGAIVTVVVDSVTDNPCAGGSVGAVYITSSGGTPGYSYDWSNGASNEDIIGLIAGTYTVTVQDAIGCTASGTGIVADGATVVVTLDSSSNVTCNGAADGSISISVSGGSSAYTYVWDNTETTEDISGLSGGDYSVVVNDANGCTATFGPVTIIEPDLLKFTLDSVNNVKCFGDNSGAVYITTSGGTAPTTILWSNAAITEDITGLTAATYTAVLTDANGCTTNVSGTVTQPSSALSATSVVTNQIQGGAMGSVNVTISGGTSPYTSLWSNSTTTEDLSSVAAGVYTCTITDANGCTQTIADTVNLVTEIGSIKNTVGINLYPNPTKDIVTLDLTLSEASNVSVEVYNVTGQFISQFEQKNILSTKFELDFTNEAAGVYYAKIKVNDATITRRIVVAK